MQQTACAAAKQALRRVMRQRAAARSAADTAASSRQICAAVIASAQFQAAQTVFVYVSVRNEPDTAEILRSAWDAGKAGFVPRCGKAPMMQAVRIHSPQDLQPGAFGIPEPVARCTETAEGTQLALAIVPCLAASHDGGRLGHGAGYYDAFLRNSSAIRLCLCPAALLCDAIPMDAHDVRMEYVATERGLFACVPTGQRTKLV